MDFKLYVGNLPYTVTTDDLKQLFAGAGNVVDAVVIVDRQTNRSKGFGFVTMSSQEEMNKAIEMFNEKDFQGRNLRVNPARPLERRP
jgi:RNA recognition motif-containing protein